MDIIKYNKRINVRLYTGSNKQQTQINNAQSILWINKKKSSNSTGLNKEKIQYRIKRIF